MQFVTSGRRSSANSSVADPTMGWLGAARTARRVPGVHSLLRRLAPAVITIAAAGVWAAPAAAALPDLVSEPAGDPHIERYVDGRLLLRFNGYVTNAIGAGPLEIRASDPDPRADVMRKVSQWRDVTGPGTGGSPVAAPAGGAPTVVFEANDDHNHYHLKNAAEYTLWTDDLSVQVATAQKTEAGFCIEDSDPAGGTYSVAQNHFCWQDHVTGGQSTLVMGISPGFRDVYGWWLSFQWIDISNVAPGAYRLGARVDPGNVIAESDETANNGYAFRSAVVPGYRARPVTAAQGDGPVPVTLRADAFDPSGKPRFRILTAPAHGSLSRAVGSPFADPALVYTPEPGYRGSDTFTYSARDDASGYPLEAPAAAVTIAGASPVVAITGAPAGLTAGTGIRLTAAGGGVTWSVGGVAGGDAARGTISPDGVYQAPATPPPGGAVTIRATSVAAPDAWSEVRIAIAAVHVQAAAPAAACAEVATRSEPARGAAGRIVMTRGQLLTNQRIAQAAVRRANAIEAWLDGGVESRDLCGGAIGLAQLGPGVIAGDATTQVPLTTADPRPLRPEAPVRRNGASVRLSARQLLINQRVSQAAVRRLNALARRLDGGLTGGDLVEGAVGPGKLSGDIRIVKADATVPRPAPSRTARGSGPAGRVALRLTAGQLRINQRIAQEAVRRGGALADQLKVGLSSRHFADGTVVATDLAGALRP